MSESSEPQASQQPSPTAAERRRQAILRCTKGALSNAQKALEAEHLDLIHLLSNYMGGYCRHLPEICDQESACDFIACVVYGMSIEAIAVDRASKLLYGAQVALTAFRPPKEGR